MKLTEKELDRISDNLKALESCSLTPTEDVETRTPEQIDEDGKFSVDSELEPSMCSSEDRDTYERHVYQNKMDN